MFWPAPWLSPRRENLFEEDATDVFGFATPGAGLFVGIKRQTSGLCDGQRAHAALTALSSSLEISPVSHW